MPPPSLILRGNNGNSVDRATAYGRTAFSRSATDADPITAYLGGLHESGSAPPSHSVVEGRMLLAFRHLDLVLAIAAQGAGQGDVNRLQERILADEFSYVFLPGIENLRLLHLIESFAIF